MSSDFQSDLDRLPLGSDFALRNSSRSQLDSYEAADPAVSSSTGDGAYDRNSIYADVHERHPEAEVIVPSRRDAVPSGTHPSSAIATSRRSTSKAGWPGSGYNVRARVEGQIGRWKRIIGDSLRFHTDEAQAAEVTIAVEVLNRMLDLGRSKSVRVA